MLHFTEVLCGFNENASFRFHNEHIREQLTCASMILYTRSVCPNDDVWSSLITIKNHGYYLEKSDFFLFDWSSSIILMVKNSMLCDPLLSQNSYNFGDIYQKVAEEEQLHHSILSVYFYFKIHGVLNLYKHH